MAEIINIAFADDHSLYRKALITTLCSLNDQIRFVIEADNGITLIEQLSRVESLPDLCILDINMPEMNGYETMRQIYQKWPQLKVLAFSMHNDESAIINMFRRGASGYAVKYGNPSDILTAIISINQKGYYHSELIEGIINKDPTFPRIKDQELLFLQYCCQDLNYQEIADKMNVSYRTIEWYRDSLFKKIGVNTRSGLTLFAIKIGLAQLNLYP